VSIELNFSFVQTGKFLMHYTEQKDTVYFLNDTRIIVLQLLIDITSQKQP